MEIAIEIAAVFLSGGYMQDFTEAEARAKVGKGVRVLVDAREPLPDGALRHGEDSGEMFLLSTGIFRDR